MFTRESSASTLWSAATASGAAVGTVVPKPPSQEGGNKDGEVTHAQNLVWSRGEPLRWLSVSEPPVVMECKTHSQSLIRCATIFYIHFPPLPLSPRFSRHTSLTDPHTLVPCGAHERKLMLERCWVQEADLAVWLVWLSPGKTGSEKVNEGLIYWFSLFFSAISGGCSAAVTLTVCVGGDMTWLLLQTCVNESVCVCVSVDASVTSKHACVYAYVCVYVCLCVGQVVGRLPVFSLARLHTTAWQQRAGQLNSFGRGEESERGKGRGGEKVRREVEGLWGPDVLECTHTHTRAHTHTRTHTHTHTHTHTRTHTHKAIYIPWGSERGL